MLHGMQKSHGGKAGWGPHAARDAEVTRRQGWLGAREARTVEFSPTSPSRGCLPPSLPTGLRIAFKKPDPAPVVFSERGQVIKFHILKDFYQGPGIPGIGSGGCSISVCALPRMLHVKWQHSRDVDGNAV